MFSVRRQILNPGIHFSVSSDALGAFLSHSFKEDVQIFLVTPLLQDIHKKLNYCSIKIKHTNSYVDGDGADEPANADNFNKKRTWGLKGAMFAYTISSVVTSNLHKTALCCYEKNSFKVYPRKQKGKLDILLLISYCLV